MAERLRAACVSASPALTAKVLATPPLPFANPPATLAAPNASASDVWPIATQFLAGTQYRSPTNPRGWNPVIFPGFTTAAPLAEQQSTWLNGFTSYMTNTGFPRGRAVRARGWIFWDGFTGQEFPELLWDGDPEYEVPEVPRSSVQAALAFCAANGQPGGMTIRPTIRNQAELSQKYGPDPMATYRAKLTRAVADGGRFFWFDSSLKGSEGQTYLEATQYFTQSEAAALSAEYPDAYMVWEWYHETYKPVPRLRAYHDPGYGYLPSDVPDDDSWDAYAQFYFGNTTNPRDPAQAAVLAAQFRRGARLLLYCGADFELEGQPGYTTDQQRADLWALWLQNYPF